MSAPTVPTKTNTKANYVKSVAWLIEATFRAYAGYMLVSNFRHNYAALAAAVYALITAAMIVVTHFAKAHN